MSEDDLPLDEGSDPDRGEGDDPDPEGGPLDHLTSAFVLRAREPFVRWVRQILGESDDWTLPPIESCRAFLTPELPTQALADTWLAQNYAELFGRCLEPWMDDETRWPVDRSFEAFLAWFDVIFAPAVDDMTGENKPAFTCDPISLRRVLAEFLELPPDGSLHVEVETGELFAWTDREIEAIHAGNAQSAGVSPEDMRALQEAFASESLIEIAHRGDVENVHTMATFAVSIASPAVKNRLLGVLDGKKAGTRFRQAVDIAGLRHRWSAFLEQEAAKTLRESMDERGVPFVDDMDDRRLARITAPSGSSD
jgi:hypothetical protein